jgi:hypothetical protein
MAPKRRARATTSCPQCGGEFPSGRLACPHCGSDAQTGWKNESDDYAFTDEDYEEVVADLEDRDDLNSPKWRRRKLLIRVVGLIVVASMVLAFVALGRDLFR